MPSEANLKAVENTRLWMEKNKELRAELNEALTDVRQLRRDKEHLQQVSEILLKSIRKVDEAVAEERRGCEMECYWSEDQDPWYSARRRIRARGEASEPKYTYSKDGKTVLFHGIGDTDD